MLVSRFALRPMPREDEDWSSLAARSAVANGIPMDVAKEVLGLPSVLCASFWATAGDGDAHVQILAAALGLDPEDVARLSLRPVMRWAVGSQPMGPGFWHGVFALFRRWCGTCLAESPHAKRLWQVRAVELCPKHSEPLRDACPHCGSRQMLLSPIDRCAFCRRTLVISADAVEASPDQRKIWGQWEYLLGSGALPASGSRFLGAFDSLRGLLNYSLRTCIPLLDLARMQDAYSEKAQNPTKSIVPASRSGQGWNPMDKSLGQGEQAALALVPRERAGALVWR